MRWNRRTDLIQSAPIIQLIEESKMSDSVISLGQGIPFFGPPKDVMDASAQYSYRKEGHVYSKDQGIDALRLAIKKKLKKENNIDVDTNQIMVTSGANQAFMNCVLSITNPDDELILLTPIYFNYVMAVKLCGCKPVFVPTDNQNFYPDIENIKSMISSKTRAIVTISPNNPTGKVYPKNILESINMLCKDTGIYHISDEVYEYFVYDNYKHISPANFDHDVSHTISLFSCSKSYGMSGYRIGCIVHPVHLFSDLLKVQDAMSICPTVPSQYAACYAFYKGQSYMHQYLSEIDDIRQIFYNELNEIDDIIVDKPQGAIYFYIQFNKKIDTWKLSKDLIEQYKVITIPGEVFYSQFSSLRISFGNVKKGESIEGIARLKKGLSNLV